MSDPKAWQDSQPLTGNLPEVYRSNPVSVWLSSYWDKFLMGLKTRIDEIATKQLNPNTCDAEWLDYLASLSGFTSDYWDTTWGESIKRSLIQNGLSFLRWTRRVGQKLDRE
jgi:phage tail P2-like protein